MKVLGLRFCKVAHTDEARALAEILGENGLGLKANDMGPPDMNMGDGFQGAVFPAGDSDNGGAQTGLGSWIEIWPAGEAMPKMTMLQIVVDDADAWAARAKKNGLDVKGPDDAHGERIYYLEGPGGLPISFQSKVTS